MDSHNEKTNLYALSCSRTVHDGHGSCGSSTMHDESSRMHKVDWK